MLGKIIEFFEDEQDEKLVEQLIKYLNSNFNAKFKLKKMFYLQNSVNPLVRSYFSNLFKLYNCSKLSNIDYFTNNTKYFLSNIFIEILFYRNMFEKDLELDINWRLELFKVFYFLFFLFFLFYEK